MDNSPSHFDLRPNAPASLRDCRGKSDFVQPQIPTFPASHVRKHFSAMMDEVMSSGGVYIIRYKKERFLLSPAPIEKSMLDVTGVKSEVTMEQLVMAVGSSERPG